jgi:hypothetical protein
MDNYIDNLYQLFRLQHDLNTSRIFEEKLSIWNDIHNRVNLLDDIAKQLKIRYNMAIQNSTAYLAENKEYYFKHSERAIKARIEDIIAEYINLPARL